MRQAFRSDVWLEMQIYETKTQKVMGEYAA
jgi:hypothetical protein